MKKPFTHWIVFQKGGSGMAITGEPPNLPGCQGQVTASDFANNCQNCNACIASHPCGECQYWPIYPCYSSNVRSSYPAKKLDLLKFVKRKYFTL